MIRYYKKLSSHLTVILEADNEKLVVQYGDSPCIYRDPSYA